jgi:predicted RNase H-like HicB family nuclease
LRFRAVFEKRGPWYVGYVLDLPGVNAQERSLKEARKSLRAALRELAEIDGQKICREPGIAPP